MFYKFKDEGGRQVILNTERISFIQQSSYREGNTYYIYTTYSGEIIEISGVIYQALLERLEPILLIEK